MPSDGRGRPNGGVDILPGDQGRGLGFTFDISHILGVVSRASPSSKPYCRTQNRGTEPSVGQKYEKYNDDRVESNLGRRESGAM